MSMGYLEKGEMPVISRVIRFLGLFCSAGVMLGIASAAGHGTAAQAREGGFVLQGSEVHAFQSELLNDELQVAVSLPFEYARSGQDYPLLLALDGDVMFGMASEIPRLLSFEGKVPPMIVASVVYGDFQDWIAKRQRDFHSANGGADTFLAALKAEILPFIQQTYRIDPENQALYGHSSAGLFAFYAGVREPGLFSRILATSPSLEEEPDWAATFVGLIDANTNGLPMIYVSADTSEPAVQAALKPQLVALSGKLGAHQLKADILNEGSHMAVIPKAFTSGLHFLFAR